VAYQSRPLVMVAHGLAVAWVSGQGVNANQERHERFDSLIF
jgi:uncharacterized membrane protein (DUF441 family)